MGWKPARGSGITFNKVFNREMKYRNLLTDYQYKPVGYMEYSKTYYLWLVAERDLSELNFPHKRITIDDLYGQMISPTTLRNLEQHKELCYKPLQKYMKG
ncbi:MAG: hypothetical protein K5920_00655 [Bacteroidales bacterium]|nr:hypothetical protein [Bacteroidales bacterium]